MSDIRKLLRALKYCKSCAERQKAFDHIFGHLKVKLKAEHPNMKFISFSGDQQKIESKN